MPIMTQPQPAVSECSTVTPDTGGRIAAIFCSACVQLKVPNNMILANSRADVVAAPKRDQRQNPNRTDKVAAPEGVRGPVYRRNR